MPKSTKSLEERLQAHPELKEQVLGLLELAESGIDRGSCKTPETSEFLSTRRPKIEGMPGSFW